MLTKTLLPFAEKPRYVMALVTTSPGKKKEIPCSCVILYLHCVSKRHFLDIFKNISSTFDKNFKNHCKYLKRIKISHG